MAQYQPQQTRRIMMLLMTLVVSCLCIATTTSFTPTPTQPSSFLSQGSSSTFAQYRETFPRFLVADDTIEGNPEEMIAAKIKVSGDVHGGYYRSCVTNEVSCDLVEFMYVYFLAAVNYLFSCPRPYIHTFFVLKLSMHFFFCRLVSFVD
jgi:hypothetical protein